MIVAERAFGELRKIGRITNGGRFLDSNRRKQSRPPASWIPPADHRSLSRIYGRRREKVEPCQARGSSRVAAAHSAV